MEHIEFEGKIIKPSPTGIYKCPFGCGRKDYPAPKWKTKKGIEKHLSTCYMRPSAVAARNEVLQQKEQTAKDYQEALDFFKDEILHNLPYKIGDEIYYIHKHIVKDTHEWRGNRRVHVRYEPILSFTAQRESIREINFCKPDFEPTPDNAQRLIYFNNGIGINSLLSSYEEAKKIAGEKTKADEEYRNQCSQYR
jgi:hypothetical protein